MKRTGLHRYCRLTLMVWVFFSAIDLATSSAQAESIFPSTHRPWVGSSAERDIRCTVLVTPLGRIDTEEILRQASWNAQVLVVEDDAQTVQRSLKSSLRNAEVLLCSQAAWNALASDSQGFIEENIRRGMGFVLVDLGISPGSPEAPSAWEPIPSPPQLTAAYSLPEQMAQTSFEPIGSTYRLGEGRIARWYSAHTPRVHELVPIDALEGIRVDIAYDYRIAQLLRSVQWTVQRKSTVQLQAIEVLKTDRPDPSVVPPQLPPEFLESMLDARQHLPTRSLKLHLSRPAPKAYTVEVRLRHPHRNDTFLYRPPMLWGKGLSEYTLHVPATRGTVWLDVWILAGDDVVDWHSISTVHPSWPMLQQVEFAQQHVRPSDSLSLSFFVRPNRHAPAPSHAFIQVTDTLDRIIAQRKVIVPAEGGRVSTSIAWNDALTRQLRVDVFLTENHVNTLSPWAKRTADYTRSTLTVEQPNSDLLHWGINGLSQDEPGITRAHRRLVALGGGLLQVPEGSVTGSSTLSENLATASHLGALPTPILNDQGHAVPCPSSQIYREDQYALIENKLFHHPPSTTQFFSLSSMEDHTFSLGNTLCSSSSCRDHLQQQLRHIYPDVAALNAVWNTSFDAWAEVKIPADSIAFTAAQTDLRMIRAELQSQVLQRLHRQVREHYPTTPVGVCVPEDATALSQDWSRVLPDISWVNAPFNPLLLDKIAAYRSPETSTGFSLSPQAIADSSQWPWYALFHGFDAVWVDQDRPSDTLVPFADAFEAIDLGVDALLRDAEAVAPQIALYENDITRLSLDEAGRTAVLQAQQSWVTLLQSAGLHYTFVSYRQLLEDGLKDYRLVILPRVDALRPEEDMLLSHYAEQGGGLLADTLPGRLDEHGQVAERTPSLHAWVEVLSLDESSSAQDDLLALSEKLGVPRIHPEQVRARSGPPPTQWFHYRYGKAHLYGALRHDARNDSMPNLTIPEGYWGYDLLHSNTGAPRKGSLRPTLNESRASLFVYLPYRVSRLLIETPEEITRAQRLNYTVTLKTYDALPGDHLFAVRLLDSLGESIEHYEHTVTFRADEGKATGYIPLAINEPFGAYRLEVRDTLTGLSVTRPIDIVSQLSSQRP